MPLSESDLEKSIQELGKDELLLVAVYMDMLASKSEYEIHARTNSNIFERWEIHHNRGVMLYNGLKRHYKRIKDYFSKTATGEGVLVPVSRILKIAIWICLMLIFTLSIVLANALHTPEKCDEARCQFWSRFNAVMLGFGAMITIIGMLEALLEDGRNLKSIFAGRIRVRNISGAAFWTNEKPNDLISLLWIPYLTKIKSVEGEKYKLENNDKFLHGDIINASYLRLVRESYADQGILSDHSPYRVKFGMWFPHMTYNDLKHLFYITADKSAVVGLNSAKTIKFTNRKVYVFPTYDIENATDLQSSYHVPDKNESEFYFD